MAALRYSEKVFIYDDTLSPKDKDSCERLVRSLGGISNLSETYISEATHVVVADCNALGVISPKVLGCLASGKHVVTTEYLRESAKHQQFLQELMYIKAVSYTHLTLPTKA